MQEIMRATQSVNKNSAEQTAYFRALAEKNKLNVDKFREQVEKELGKDSKKKSGNNFTLVNISTANFSTCVQHFFQIIFLRLIISENNETPSNSIENLDDKYLDDDATTITFSEDDDPL